jgi:hypothetical protein
MFVVDLLLEFELGVWRTIFTHLMRILHAVGGTTVQRLNYRQDASFRWTNVCANLTLP